MEHTLFPHFFVNIFPSIANIFLFFVGLKNIDIMKALFFPSLILKAFSITPLNVKIINISLRFGFKRNLKFMANIFESESDVCALVIRIRM